MNNPRRETEKFKFMREFILNRCLGGTNGTDGEVWAREAEKAWEHLEARTEPGHRSYMRVPHG